VLVRVYRHILRWLLALSARQLRELSRPELRRLLSSGCCSVVLQQWRGCCFRRPAEACVLFARRSTSCCFACRLHIYVSAGALHHCCRGAKCLAMLVLRVHGGGSMWFCGQNGVGGFVRGFLIDHWNVNGELSSLWLKINYLFLLN